MTDRAIDFEIREINEETRTVSGIALPYGELADVGGYKERFERGAFADTEIGAPLYFHHDHRALGTPIGSIVEARDTDDGLQVKARISKTPKGDEVYTLLKDGVLKKFSAGFEPVEHRTDSDGTVVRTKARLVEVSIVPRPAYSTADVAEVRAADTNEPKETAMPEETIAPEVVELREAVNDLERKIAVIGDATPTSDPLEVRSFGEFVKGLATGETRDKVELVTRAFTGATSADSNPQPAWVSQALRLIEDNRDVLNLFTKAPLPPTGNSIEYPRVNAVTGTVGAQAAEGDDLPYMEVGITTATAPVITYGGYSSLSRQSIERSDVAYLDTVLRYMAIQYAKATNGAVRTALTGATGLGAQTLSADTPQAWLDLVIDSTASVEDNGVAADFMLVSRDVYRRIARLTDTTNRPLFVLNGDGVNTFGTVTAMNKRGQMAGLSIVVDPNAAANTTYIGSREAITVFESPGAPFRLQDENIINLTKDFSLYGYMAVAVTHAASMVRADVDLVA